MQPSVSIYGWIRSALKCQNTITAFVVRPYYFFYHTDDALCEYKQLYVTMKTKKISRPLSQNFICCHRRSRRIWILHLSSEINGCEVTV